MQRLDRIKDMIRTLLIYFTVKCLMADLCTTVNTYDCETQYAANESEDICGTDGVWYHNFCYYAQAKCKNSTLDIQYTGPCDQNVTLIQNSTYNTILINATLNDNNRTTMATTTSSTTTTTTYDPIKQIFCEAVLAGNVKCTNELDPYCGTDGQWYLNNCDFEKSKCTNEQLEKQDINMCKESHPST